MKMDAEIPAADELVRRAEAIAETLVARMAETEQRGFYAEDTHQAFQEAGLYRVLAPKKYGGYEIDVGTFSRIVQAIARGCPSTAWCYGFAVGHSINICTMVPQAAWDDIFADGPDFLAPLTIKPQAEIVQQADDSWLISGQYDYCSGVPYSSHFGSQAIPVYKDGTKGSPVTFIARREDWTRLDNWGDGDMLGMNGSGSHSIVFDKARIPDNMVLRTEVLSWVPEPRDPANPQHGDAPIYYGRFTSTLILEISSIAVGAVKGALDEAAEMTKTRMTMRPPVQPRYLDSDYRRWFGDATGKIAVCEAALDGMSRRWMRAATNQMNGTAPFSIAEELSLIYIVEDVIKQAWQAMDTIWFSVGSSAQRKGERLQRIYRDMSCIRNHALNTFTDLACRNLADELLGTQDDTLDSFLGTSYKLTGTQR